MPQWVHEKRAFLERDILHDFCRFCRVIQEQFARFETSGSVSSPVLHALVGDVTNKGLLWRLKDNAHLVLRGADEASSAATDKQEYCHTGILLDWTLGYLYHESVKLMEDAHLRQSYIARLQDFADAGRPVLFGDTRGSSPGDTPGTSQEGHDAPPDPPKGLNAGGDGVAGHLPASLLEHVAAIREQTAASMEREVSRLKELVQLAHALFCAYFSDLAGHRPLARFLYDNDALVREAFAEEYPALLAAIYGQAPERLYIEAAWSLLESARNEAAAKALDAATACNPESPLFADIRGQLKK